MSLLFVEGTDAALPSAAEEKPEPGETAGGTHPKAGLSSFNCSMKPDGQEPCTSMAVPLPPKPRLRTEAADREKPRRTERGRGFEGFPKTAAAGRESRGGQV